MDTFSDPPNPFSLNPSPAPSEHAPPSPPSQNLKPMSAASSSISAASGSPPPTSRASFPNPGVGGRSYVGPKVKEGVCCDRDKDITAGVEIKIIDAQKTTEGGRASYITYVIRTGDHETRRRYSAFDSLRTALTSLYPVLIVPPIPSKQSLADYAVKGQSKAKEDATVIARRIRMLEDFLRRVARHPILGGEHVFHRFLEAGVSWTEVLNTPPLSLLPKNPLHAPSHNPTLQPSSPSSSPIDLPSPDSASPTPSTPYIAHHLIPSPSSSHPLKTPDQRFLDSEAFTDRFSSHMSGTMEKVNRRVVKRWGEIAHEKNELGAVLNGFSLEQKGELGTAVEKVGQAVDAEYMSTAALLQAWERTTTEPLHIYAQYGLIIRQRLAFRHQKHVQYELVQDTLEAQRDKLEVLEKAEREARRLEEALESGGRTLSGSVVRTDEELQAERERAVRRKQSGGGGGYGFLSAVKHSIGGMMDVDPEATRRANIGKTRDNISQLEDSLQASAQDLKYASMTLQADLDRFQRQKVADLRDLAIALAGVHRDWCRQNLTAWQEAQSALLAIPPHPNQLPKSAPADAGPSIKRSDTAVTIRPESVVANEREVDAAAAVPLPLPIGVAGAEGGWDEVGSTGTVKGYEGGPL